MMMATMMEDKENEHVNSETAVDDDTVVKDGDDDSTTAVTENANSEEQTLDIVINNVVCTFNVRCHLDLRKIALNGTNVEYKRENQMVTMKLRKPYATASLWSSGKITCTGATSEDLSKVASRRFARILQKLGFRTRFTNYRVVNVLGTCSMPFAIRITELSRDHRSNASYEPELHPGVTYRVKEPKATLKIFSTGSITVTAPSVGNVQAAIEHIFPIVHQYRRERPPPPQKGIAKDASPPNHHRHRKARLDSRPWGRDNKALKRRRVSDSSDDEEEDDDDDESDEDQSS